MDNYFNYRWRCYQRISLAQVFRRYMIGIYPVEDLNNALDEVVNIICTEEYS